MSTRGRVSSGEQVLIGGFIITGSSPKEIVLRALGPSLQTKGISDPLPDPVLELHGGDGALLLTNNNWGDTQGTEISATGLAPADPREAAILFEASPGTYTAVVTSHTGESGVGLIEAYDLNPTSKSKLANISTRGLVQTGTDVLIGGLMLNGTGGTASVVVRGIGPSLAAAGVKNPLADPTLKVHDGNGALIFANDNWLDDPVQAARIAAAGLSPTNRMESAIIGDLPAGNYTVVLSGQAGATGIGLVEIYTPVGPAASSRADVTGAK